MTAFLFPKSARLNNPVGGFPKAENLLVRTLGTLLPVRFINNQDRTAPSGTTGLNVSPTIPDKKTLVQVYSVNTRSSVEEAWRRLAAVAMVRIVMRTHPNSVKGELFPQVRMDCF
jgi:hypothetical protein